MGLWSSMVERAKAIRNGAGTSAHWLWENASLSKVVTYTANTAFQILEQGLALRKAIPTLIYNEKAWKIVNGMYHVVAHEVVPLVTLNAVNNSMQNYFREGHQDDTAWLTPYSVFLTGLTLVNYGVRAYTWQQGAETTLHILALDSLGPPAFNSNKTTPPNSLCTDLKCNTNRRVKGWGREPLILMGNDLLTGAIYNIPYVGPSTSRVLSVYFIGRYVTRLVTPERCERHKAMMQESVLALGLSYEATTMLMDMFLNATSGMPPYLYYRAMRHLLLLLHINVAAHMTLPLVLPKDAIMYVDPLNVYERVSRFIADVIFAGLKVRVPIDFKLEEGAKPIIPLSTALKLGTKLLNSDLPVLKQEKPGFFKQKGNALRPWIIPPMLRTTDGLINDPIISQHWPVLREGAISTVETLNSIGRTNKVSSTLVATAKWVPGTAEKALNYKWGIPKVVTRVGLRLSKKEDFWDFAAALKAWFERHNVSFEVVLVNNPQVPLLGDKSIVPLPTKVDDTPIVPALKLVSDRPKSETVLSPRDLAPNKMPLALMPAASPDSLFTTRKRPAKPVSVGQVPVVEQSVSGPLYEHKM